MVLERDGRPGGTPSQLAACSGLVFIRVGLRALDPGAGEIAHSFLEDTERLRAYHLKGPATNEKAALVTTVGAALAGMKKARPSSRQAASCSLIARLNKPDYWFPRLSRSSAHTRIH